MKAAGKKTEKKAVTNPGNDGFSFVELIVVIFILSALAFVTIPQFLRPEPSEGLSNSQGLANLLSELRQKAIREGQAIFLHLDQTTGKAWVSRNGEKEEEKQNEEDQAMVFPVTGIELLNRTEPEVSDTLIRFYPGGYTDPALIHLAEGEERIEKTVRLHPFLAEAEILYGEVRFARCR